MRDHFDSFVRCADSIEKYASHINMELSKNKEQVILVKEAMGTQFSLPGCVDPLRCHKTGLLPRHEQFVLLFECTRQQQSGCVLSGISRAAKAFAS